MLKKDLSKNANAVIILISELSERDTVILVERFIRNKSLKQVAKQFDLTPTRIKDIEDYIINKIDSTIEYINV